MRAPNVRISIRLESDSEADANGTGGASSAFHLVFKIGLVCSNCHLTAFMKTSFPHSENGFLCGLLGHCAVSPTGFSFCGWRSNPFLPAASRNAWCACQCATREGFILPPLNGMAAIQQAWVHV